MPRQLAHQFARVLAVTRAADRLMGCIWCLVREAVGFPVLLVPIDHDSMLQGEKS